jgi:hypothetical protein
MKSLLGLGGILFATAPLLQAEIDSEIPLGIEAVTGLRSSYVHRGFELADTSLDFQMEAEVTLSDETWINLGLAHLAESDGDFSETTAYFEMTHEWTKKFTTGASLAYRNRNASLLDSGFDLGFFTSYAISNDWKWHNEINFDFGESGIHLATEIEWSHVVSDKSFVTVEGGLSVVSDYLDRNGFNDLYARIAFTYAISDRVALTPFFGTSLQLTDHTGDDVAYGGFWFEVIF